MQWAPAPLCTLFSIQDYPSLPHHRGTGGFVDKTVCHHITSHCKFNLNLTITIGLGLERIQRGIRRITKEMGAVTYNERIKDLHLFHL